MIRWRQSGGYRNIEGENGGRIFQNDGPILDHNGGSLQVP